MSNLAQAGLQKAWRLELTGDGKRRGRRSAQICLEETFVKIGLFSRKEPNVFHRPILSSKIVQAHLHGKRMKTIAYLRVSTAQQDAGSQRLAILGYARKNGFQIDDFVEATARGQASVKHRRFDELIGILNRGDRLVVSELSRLGRSLGQIVTVLDGFANARVSGKTLGRPKGSLVCVTFAV